MKILDKMKEKDHDIDEEIEEPWYNGPIKIILSLFLLLILVTWIFSAYVVKIDPQPNRIPKIDEVYSNDVELNVSDKPNILTKQDYYNLIRPEDPLVKQTADKIVSIACDGSKVCHAKAVFYFVRDNFQYVSDPTTFEYVKDSRESLAVGGGDCDDSSILLSTLLESVGIPTKLVFVPKHVYVKAYLPEAAKRYKQEDDWINLDATCKNCGFGEIVG